MAADAGDGNWRVLRRAGPHDLTVVALPLDTVDGATSKILWLNGLLLVVTVVALWVLGREVVRLSLPPLTRMERAAEALTAGQLDLRLPDTDPRTEIGRLGAVPNTMLDRLQQALQEREASEGRLRRFVADAGHELRTPLTAIQGFAQLALRSDRRTARERQEADRHIAQNAERMSLLVDDLQLLAGLDRHPDYQQENVDLLSLAADAVSSAALQRPGHPVSLSPCPTAPPTPGKGKGNWMWWKSWETPTASGRSSRTCCRTPTPTPHPAPASTSAWGRAGLAPVPVAPTRRDASAWHRPSQPEPGSPSSRSRTTTRG